MTDERKTGAVPPTADLHRPGWEEGRSLSESHEVIPLVEEQVRIAKREVVGGRVRVRTVTETGEEIARETLREATIEVTRVPIDRVIEAGEPAPPVRTEGDETVGTVLEEILVVEKRLLLKEELHLRRQVTAEDVEVPVTVRRQRAVVERLDANGNPIQDEETRS